MIPHETRVERKTIAVMLDGEKVGTAIATGNGMLSVSLTSQKVIDLLMPPDIQHLSIEPKH